MTHETIDSEQKRRENGLLGRGRKNPCDFEESTSINTTEKRRKDFNGATARENYRKKTRWTN